MNSTRQSRAVLRTRNILSKSAYSIFNTALNWPNAQARRIELALQGYNYGAGYITWALENHGGYSLENAEEFARMMMELHGTSGYGDMLYAPHVLRYYHI